MTLLDHETLRRSYERSAPTYDERFRALQSEKYAVMLGETADLGRGPWLDLGCGTGLLKAHLGERGLDTACLVGLDFSRAMLERARTRGLPVAQGGMDVLPFHDAAFGAVFAFTALGIVPDVELERHTLAEVARVLERGGVFVLTVLQVNHDLTLAERLRAAGFRTNAARACGQDVGYRCVRA
jgi:ubiquinone/menaquinone biosynthesis C-methylase UbiE